MKKTCARWRRLRPHPTSRRADAAPVLATELLPTTCFGSLSEAEQLAMKGLVTAGQRPPARGATRHPSDDDRAPGLG